MAYTFTRTTGEYIRWAHISALDEQGLLSASFWVYSSGLAAYDRVFAQYITNEGVQVYLESSTSSEDRTLYIRWGNAVLYNYYKQLIIPELGWHHVFISYNGSLSMGSRIRAWVDGTEISGWNFAEAPSLIGTATGDPFTVGAASSGGGNSMGGAIAEVAMWIGEAITDTTLISNLAAGRNPLDATNGRPTGLDWYAPLRTDAVEVIHTETGTVTGVSTSTHPSVDDIPGGGGSTFVPQIIMVL